jgi:hypothetical protein
MKMVLTAIMRLVIVIVQIKAFIHMALYKTKTNYQLAKR